MFCLDLSKNQGGNMRTKVKAFIAFVGVLLAVTALSLIIIGRGPLYGKAKEKDRIPDMTGVWTYETAQYYFEDVTNPKEEPKDRMASSTPEEDWHITHQTGRVFAGTFGFEGEGKLTGVILPDGTVSIQIFWASETRIFFTGRMLNTKGISVMAGYFHYFDDFNPGGTGDKWMGSGYSRAYRED
jgi:hypothetical protein